MEDLAKKIIYVDLPVNLQPCGKALADLANQAVKDLADSDCCEAVVAALVKASDALHSAKLTEKPKPAPKNPKPKSETPKAKPAEEKKKDDK